MNSVPNRLVVATRQSDLALWQAEFVKSQLQKIYPHIQINILGMTTQGDRLLTQSLASAGGKGLFIKELEGSLLRGEADIAVHSLKDVPAVLPNECVLAAFLGREDPCDAFVSNKYLRFDDLPSGARVATASIRRVSQLRRYRPDISYIDIRGNVLSRLEKMNNGFCEALILASAGLKRLGLEACIRHPIDFDILLPAVGQGALAIECLRARTDVFNFLQALVDPVTSFCVRAERVLSYRLGGSCTTPLSALASYDIDNILKLRARLVTPEGSDMIEASASSLQGDPDALGNDVADTLLNQGAKSLLASLGVFISPR